MSNDFEMAIETVPVEFLVIEPGKICLDAKLFSEIIRSLPDEKVLIQTDELFRANIKSGKSEFEINGRSADDFPETPAVEKTLNYEIPSVVLKNLIRQTIFSVSADESKPVFTGELLEIKGDELNVVAMDGYRLSARKAKLDGAGLSTKLIAPAKTLNEVSKLLESSKENVAIYFTDKHVLFKLSSCTATSRLIDGAYMDYARILTDEYKLKTIVSRSEFAACLERTSIISKEPNKHPVRLRIDADLITLSSINEYGATREEILADSEGPRMEIGFNPRYIIDALKAIDEDQICLLFTSPLSPMIIKSVERDDYRYLILPLRLR
jgi:DNA polymerase-3 subunit beta